MIYLNKEFIVGSSISLNLNFTDNSGNWYLPYNFKYSFLAQNKNKEDWSVVSEIYNKSIEIPTSIYNLVIPANLNISNSDWTNERQLLVSWTYISGSHQLEVTSTIGFKVIELPHIINKPSSDSSSELPPLTTPLTVSTCQLHSNTLIHLGFSRPLDPAIFNDNRLSDFINLSVLATQVPTTQVPTDPVDPTPVDPESPDTSHDSATSHEGEPSQSDTSQSEAPVGIVSNLLFEVSLLGDSYKDYLISFSLPQPVATNDNGEPQDIALHYKELNLYVHSTALDGSSLVDITGTSLATDYSASFTL